MRERKRGARKEERSGGRRREIDREERWTDSATHIHISPLYSSLAHTEEGGDCMYSHKRGHCVWEMEKGK